MDNLTPEMQRALKLAQALGQNGDSMLVHINPQEAALLDKVTDGGSINPKTGLVAFEDDDSYSYASFNEGNQAGSGYGGTGYSYNDADYGGSGGGGSGGHGSVTDETGRSQAWDFDQDKAINPDPEAPTHGPMSISDFDTPEEFDSRQASIADNFQGPEDQGAWANFAASPGKFAADWASRNAGMLGGLGGFALGGPIGAAIGSGIGNYAFAGKGLGESAFGALGGLAGGALGSSVGLSMTGGLAGNYGGGQAGAAMDAASSRGGAPQGTGVAAGEQNASPPDPFNNEQGYNDAIVRAIIARQQAA